MDASKKTAFFARHVPHPWTLFTQPEKSFVFNNGEAYAKKGQNNFDVTMGAWDGAEIAELVGLYLLHQMSTNVFKANEFGLYRDDGLD